MLLFLFRLLLLLLLLLCSHVDLRRHAVVLVLSLMDTIRCSSCRPRCTMCTAKQNSSYSLLEQNNKIQRFILYLVWFMVGFAWMIHCRYFKHKRKHRHRYVGLLEMMSVENLSESSRTHDQPLLSISFDSIPYRSIVTKDKTHLQDFVCYYY